MNEYQAESQADRGAEERYAEEQGAYEETTHQLKFKLMNRVRTPEGYVGHITGYDEGYFNIRVTFDHRSAWYNDAELTGV